jgi:hypothetical protein
VQVQVTISSLSGKTILHVIGFIFMNAKALVLLSALALMMAKEKSMSKMQFIFR